MSNYIPLNVNPFYKDTIDCTIRAISLFLDQSWDDTYIGVCVSGYILKDMPSRNTTWRHYLRTMNCKRTRIPNTCPDCYSVREFCYDHPYGRYLLALDGHVVAVVNGLYYDTWDSGDEVPLYYWRKEN